MSKREDVCTLKTLIIGNSGVGKSCLLIRFSEDKFQGNLLNTIGVDFKTKFVSVQGERVKLVLWDTAGQDRFRTITNSYYRNANGIIILYDITDRESFLQVVHWYEEMNKNIDQKVACYIVGNKADLTAKRAVSYDEGLELASRYQVPFMETSAKTALNVSDLFEDLTKQMLKLNQGTVKSARRPPPLPLKNQEDEVCKCCN